MKTEIVKASKDTNFTIQNQHFMNFFENSFWDNYDSPITSPTDKLCD